MSHKLSMKLLPALLLAGFSGTAAAAGFSLFSQGSGLGNAYAGSAAKSSDASTIFYNPAGMTQLQAREVSGGLALARPIFKFENDNSQVGAFNAAGDGGDAGQWGAVPNGALSWALNKDLYIGIAIGAPFGQKTEYDIPWKGSAQSNEFDIKTVNINPSIAYRVNEMFSIGAGFSWQHLSADYYKRLTIGATAGVKDHLTLSDDGWGWNIGVLFTPSPSTKVGLSYRSSIQYHTDGKNYVTGTGGISDLLAAGAIRAGVQSKAKADIELPSLAILSVAQKLSDKWELLGDISWMGWSSIEQVPIYHSSGARNGQLLLTLPAEFQDTFRFALGTNYTYSDSLTFQFGLAYDNSPVKNAETRLSAMPDNDRIWIAFGSKWKPDRTQTIEAGLMYEYIKDAKINHTEVGQGTLNGDYNSSGVWVFGGQYSLSF
ncbi:outer membrane protein transport protein [Accumulibacter sp.]|jgi:long-chain fatty acid transport protein|uniref:OmpP1/FadL family transporter n=1 Tax=Accumulibacter sp. TaxID=2053492 RepID=UPI001AC79252|nr:outer membrane protein transport protein [Accumulibacter sp.]MBN8451721.1 outer membrane protein transport protein [Accumulibacter sp.]MBO3706820.1 outer membrane protein transport protein [Candidatus Accumulibacter conexus]